MTIPLICACGRQIAARDEWAGKKVVCPQCKQTLTVPMPTTSECPNCHRIGPAEQVTCGGCGYNFRFSRMPYPQEMPKEEKRPGLFGLMFGTLIHPFDTMDSFFYYVNDWSMLIKMAIFYACTIPIAGFAHAGGLENFGQGIVVEIAGFAISTLCIVGAGAIVGQSGNILGAAVILAFVRAVTYSVLGLYVAALALGLTEPLIFVLLAFLAWNVLLNIAALTNIFGCSWQVALLISFLAGFLQNFGLKFLGIST